MAFNLSMMVNVRMSYLLMLILDDLETLLQGHWGRQTQKLSVELSRQLRKQQAFNGRPFLRDLDFEKVHMA